MPITFIALQCYQCSTMQVKQQKKGGNKWRCVVCNENQSVRKVFAHGHMAKDLRKFVQSFNMSRKFSEEKLQHDGDPLLDHGMSEECCGDRGLRKKARVNWTEYLDHEEEKVGDDDAGGEGNDSGLGPKIVTELPSELYKKPKLRYNASASGSGHGAGGGCNDKLYKPTFSKRAQSANRMEMIQDKIQQAYEPNRVITSRGNHHNHPIRDHKELETSFTTMVKNAVKWNEYLTQEDDDYDSKLKSARNFPADDKGQWGCDAWESTIDDLKVEDDIHPDFM